MKKKYLFIFSLFCLLTSCSKPSIQEGIYYEIKYKESFFENISSIYAKDKLLEENDFEYTISSLKSILDNSTIYTFLNLNDAGILNTKKTILINYNGGDENYFPFKNESYNHLYFYEDENLKMPRKLLGRNYYKNKEIEGYYIRVFGNLDGWKITKNQWVEEKMDISEYFIFLKDENAYNSYNKLMSYFK